MIALFKVKTWKKKISFQSASNTKNQGDATSLSGNNNYIKAREDWAEGLPDRIYDTVFSTLSGRDLLACRLVCCNWESLVTPLITQKCCLTFKGRPRFIISWVADKVTRPQSPATRFLKTCIQNPNLALGWDELRIRDLMPKSSRKLVYSLLSPQKNPSISLSNITKLHVSDSMYRFQRIHSYFALMPHLSQFSDMNTCYLLDWSICCKTFPEIQEAILKPFLGISCPVKNLQLRRDDAGFKTLFLMKILGCVCNSLEQFELSIDTFDFPFPMALIDRMDYASLVGVLLSANVSTLKEIRFQWVGHLTYHFYDDLLRCLGVMSWTTIPWTLRKVDFYFDWLFLGNPDFQSILVPFVQKLECLEDLKIRNIVLQPEWAEVLERVMPNNYLTKEPKPVVEFGVVLSDNTNLSTGQTNVNVIASMDYLRQSLKTIRVAITSEHTDELKKLVPIGEECYEFTGTTELYVQKTDWRPHMRFITFNIDRICETFKNLTVFVIADGDKIHYMRGLRKGKQWHRMSNAHIWDDDMQLILRTLVKLKTLRLRCRLVYLTDTGTTGLSKLAITEMKKCNNLHDIPDPETNTRGLSFSNLTDLQELVLQGLNKTVTDITLYHGLRGMVNLKNIELSGASEFSSQAKKWLKTTYPDCAVTFM